MDVRDVRDVRDSRAPAAVYPPEYSNRSRRPREAIPLSDYQDKGENLKRIHAQSSAETSGLGDSLQRIHTLSSTETSGYGETVPSPTAPPTPSPDGAYQRGHHGAGDPEVYTQRGHNPYHRRPNYDMPMPANGGYVGSHDTRPLEVYTRVDPNADFDQYFNQPYDRPSRQNHVKSSVDVSPHARTAASRMDDEVAEYMARNSRRASYDPGELSPGSRRGSNFLGAGTESAWLMWSQDRRASFKKKLDTLEQRQKEIEKSRVSTPVRKARKESVMFVSPELEDSHIPDEEVPELHNKLADHFPAIKMRKKQEQEKEEGKLTVAQWSALISFWEHKLFRRGRYLGILLSLVSFIFAIASVSASKWSTYKDPDGASLYSGLWTECVNTSSTTNDKHCGSIKERTWQNAVIGLLIFAVAFGFLATLLSICGVCTSTLSKKVYYFHSAGEIYFICALSIISALIVYPVAVALDGKIKDHSYGYGYGLGWGATFFYLASAMCMCLDDVVRSLTRGLCCGKDSADSRV